MKKAKLTEFEFENILSSFDMDNPAIARNIAKSLKKADLEDFYHRLLSRFCNSSDGNLLSTIVTMIWYLHFHQRFIPGYCAIILSEAIFQQKEFSMAVIRKLRESRHTEFKRMVIEMLYNYEDFFNEVEIGQIDDHILEEDPYLISAAISNRLNRQGLNQFTERIVQSGSPLLIWGMMQYYIESLDYTIMPFLEELKALNHPLINHRLDRFNKAAAIQKKMEEERREEYSSEELSYLEEDPLDYNEFYLKIDDKKTQQNLPPDEIDRIMNEMLSLI